MRKPEIENLDRSLLRTKSLLLLIPILAVASLGFYSLYQYLKFNPSELVFPTASIKVYDKDSNFLWEISKDNSVKTTPIKISEVPPNCINGIVAVEDRFFWNNVGVDFNGLGRLAISVFTGENAGGGSTITQQLIKVINERIYSRNPVDKLNEIVSALKLNNTTSKSKILEMYLNNVFFGNLNYGIESAAQDYFKKHTKDLNLAECSYLAGVPQWPGVLNPYGDLELAKARQKVVLDSMVRDGYISSEDAKQAYDTNLAFNIVPVEVKAPHYVQFLSDIILKKINVTTNVATSQDVSINKSAELHTTYNYEIHKKSLSISNEVLTSLSNRKVNNAAIVILDNENNLVTMVGSANYFDDSINGKFNSALGLRQSGTALIPFLYSYAFSKDKSPDTAYGNIPFGTTIKRGDKNENITINNFDNYESVSETLFNSLLNGYVIPSVKLTQDLKSEKVNEAFAEFSLINQEVKPECSSALVLEGCEKSLFDMTFFFSVLKNRGYKLPVTTIRSSKSFGDESENIIRKTPTQSNIHFGIEATDTVLKTNYNEWKFYNGDTSNFKDMVTFGYNSKYTVGVWTGNTKGEPTDNIKANESSEVIFKQLTDYLNTL